MSEIDLGRARADAALLMTCLGPSSKWTTLRGLLSTWDMVDVDVPGRETIERAAGLLVGSGLAEVRDATELRLTAQGRELYRSVRKKGGMRQIPDALAPVLTAALTRTAAVELSEDAYATALDSYLRPRARAEPSKAARRLKAVARFFGW